MSLAILLFALTGALAGVLAGLLGISGGVVTIPCLVAIFHYLDFPFQSLMHMAIGTSLAAMVFSTLSSTYSHSLKKSVLWKVAIRTAPGLLVGAFLGALIAKNLPSEFLQEVFGVFEILVGFLFFRKSRQVEAKGHALHGWVQPFGMGFVISTISTMLGIGGGILMVPALTYFRVPMKKAVGTSAATSLMITTVGAISFLFLGLNSGGNTTRLGYLYLPAFFTISIVTFLMAPFGVKLAHTMKTERLRKVFGVVLIAAGLTLILS